MKTQNLILIKSLKHFVMTAIPAGELEVSLAFLPRRCVETQKIQDPTEVSWEADSRFWVCTSEVLLLSCVTTRGRQCWHCCSLMVEIRSDTDKTRALSVLLMDFQLNTSHCLHWEQSKSDNSVFLLGCTWWVHSCTAQLRISSHAPLIHLTSLWSPSLLGDYTSLTSYSPNYWMFVCSRWCHQLLPAEMCPMMDHAEALDVAAGILQFLDKLLILKQ